MSSKNKPIKISKLFDWIGGKKWLASEIQPQIENLLQDSLVDTYVEPFAGGLGSFLSVVELLKKHKIKKVFLNDVNYSVINFFNCVKTDPNKVYREFAKLEKSFGETLTDRAKTLNKTKDKAEMKKELSGANDFYNQKRTEFNTLKAAKKNNDFKVSGLFLFLQSHCFNGVYRENSTGGHNVPFNWDSKTVNLQNKKSALMFYHKLFKSMKVKFSNQDAFSFLSQFQDDQLPATLFYFDPPYLNPQEKPSENKYSQSVFGIKEQEKLIEFFNNCHRALYSNHDLPLINKNLKATSKKTVYRKNFFSAKKETREQDVAEILATRKVK